MRIESQDVALLAQRMVLACAVTVANAQAETIRDAIAKRRMWFSSCCAASQEAGRADVAQCHWPGQFVEARADGSRSRARPIHDAAAECLELGAGVVGTGQGADTSRLSRCLAR
jgi:hypothetical protein